MNYPPFGPFDKLMVLSLSKDFDSGLTGLRSGLALSKVRSTASKPARKQTCFLAGAYSRSYRIREYCGLKVQNDNFTHPHALCLPKFAIVLRTPTLRAGSRFRNSQLSSLCLQPKAKVCKADMSAPPTLSLSKGCRLPSVFCSLLSDF